MPLLITNTSPFEFYAEVGNCEPEKIFALSQVSMAQVWERCPRADWLISMLRRAGISADRELRIFACRSANRALPLFEAEFPTDLRPRLAISAADRFARGLATEERRHGASVAAFAAARGCRFIPSRAAYLAGSACAPRAYAAATAVADTQPLVEREVALQLADLRELLGNPLA